MRGMVRGVSLEKNIISRENTLFGGLGTRMEGEPIGNSIRTIDKYKSPEEIVGTR